MTEQYRLRRLFLEEFTKELIRNVVVPKPPVVEEVPVPVPSEEKESFTRDQLVNSDGFIESIMEVDKTKENQKKAVPVRFEEEAPRPSSSKEEESSNLTTPDQGTWGKLSRLIADPLVKGLECAGPERPVTMNLSGVILPTAIKLSHEEIKNVIRSISIRTKKNIEEGVLNAELDHVLITAIVSEFGGSRFIIQKTSENG